MRHTFLICLFTGLLFAGGAIAVDFATAYAAYESGDYRRAYKGLRHLAVKEHVQAQYLLGLLYMDGQGVTKDTGQGISWLKQAAQGGSYLAAAELGQIYATGKGVKQDASEAAKWIELSTQLAEDEDADEGCD